MNSETNFEAKTYTCDSTPDDCIGQMVRWHLLHYAFGAESVSWFFFNTTIGHNSDYSTAYHDMMQWLVGGHFTAECSANGNVYSCPFTLANGHHALFVWNTTGNSTYNPPTQYVNYRALGGKTAAISTGHPVAIGVKPIMLEAAN